MSCKQLDRKLNLNVKGSPMEFSLYEVDGKLALEGRTVGIILTSFGSGGWAWETNLRNQFKTLVRKTYREQAPTASTFSHSKDIHLLRAANVPDKLHMQNFRQDTFVFLTREGAYNWIRRTSSAKNRKGFRFIEGLLEKTAKETTPVPTPLPSQNVKEPTPTPAPKVSLAETLAEVIDQRVKEAVDASRKTGEEGTAKAIEVLVLERDLLRAERDEAFSILSEETVTRIREACAT